MLSGFAYTALHNDNATGVSDRGQRSVVAYDDRGNALYGAKQLALIRGAGDMTVTNATAALPTVTVGANHTMATLMLEGGADIRYVQAMLGHVSLETTQIYTQVSIHTLMQIHSSTHPGATLKHPAVEEQTETDSADNKTDTGEPDKTADPDPTEADLLQGLASDAAEEAEDTLGYRPTP